MTDQRNLLSKYVNSQLDEVPQVFIPYKEVLGIYQAGLKVPEDVTLMWPDDNHGYIRRLSTPAEQKRSGGAGVYYHVSYYGAPEDYLWLCTTPPALIWEELRKAYDHGARRLWILNVGDIKPGEIDIDFFFHLARNVGAWDENAQPVFLKSWAARTFGEAYASDIAGVLDEYYRLNYAAKPEHLLEAKFTSNYGEIHQRLERFAVLAEKANEINDKLPANLRDAFYELVLYPVRASALMNDKILNSDLEKARKAYEQIRVETAFFNEKVAGGKWKGVMSASPRDRAVFGPPQPRTNTAATVGASQSSAGYIAMEAEKPDRRVAGSGYGWKTVAGLGRTGDSITLLPAGESVPAEAALEYDFTAPNAGEAQVMIYAIPTHAIHDGTKLRYAVSIDKEPAQEVNLDTAEFSKRWSENVLRAAAIGTTTHALPAGKHVLRLRPLDPGVVFDKIVIDFGGVKPSQLGPPVTLKSR